jgi:hypothetical protein
MAFNSVISGGNLVPGEKYIIVARHPSPGAEGRIMAYTGFFERYSDQVFGGAGRQVFFTNLRKADGNASSLRSTENSHFYMPYSEARLAAVVAANPSQLRNVFVPMDPVAPVVVNPNLRPPREVISMDPTPETSLDPIHINENTRRRRSTRRRRGRRSTRRNRRGRRL